ncbi:hypothetical protein H0H87_006479, partial [Tephrocybe sp. NHM501043]
EESALGGLLNQDTEDMEVEGVINATLRTSRPDPASLQPPGVQPTIAISPASSDSTTFNLLSQRVGNLKDAPNPWDRNHKLAPPHTNKSPTGETGGAQDFNVDNGVVGDYTLLALPVEVVGLSEPGPLCPIPNLVFPANWAAQVYSPVLSLSTTHAPAAANPLPDNEGGSSLLMLSKDKLAAIIANVVAQINLLSLPGTSQPAPPPLHRSAPTSAHKPPHTQAPIHTFTTTWQAHEPPHLLLPQPAELPLPPTIYYGPVSSQLGLPGMLVLGMPFLNANGQDPTPSGITPFIWKLIKPTALCHSAPPSQLVALTADDRVTPAKVQHILYAGFHKHVPLHYLTNKKMEQAAYIPAPLAPGL